MSAWIAYVNFLEHFGDLKVLHIETYFLSGSTHLPTNAIPLLRLLPASGKLRKLVFHTSVDERRLTSADFGWLRDLDAELEHQHFQDLAQVVFYFDISLEYTSKEQIVELTEGNLPKLSSRRPPILQIDVTYLVYRGDELPLDADIWSDASSEPEGDSQTSNETSD